MIHTEHLERPHGLIAVVTGIGHIVHLQTGILGHLLQIIVIVPGHLAGMADVAHALLGGECHPHLCLDRCVFTLLCSGSVRILRLLRSLIFLHRICCLYRQHNARLLPSRDICKQQCKHKAAVP